ncbi:hypothetical protein BKA70DRAFT_1027053, partial [Coprinopsis sp. MPI-PUGE-AT-0042]
WSRLSESAQWSLTRHMPLRDLFRLRDHDKITNQDISHILEERFGEQLKPFGLTCDFLLWLFEKTGAVISGPFVLSLIFPQLFTAKELHFFVPKGGQDILMKALKGTGYRSTTLDDGDEDKEDEDDGDEDDGDESDGDESDGDESDGDYHEEDDDEDDGDDDEEECKDCGDSDDEGEDESGDDEKGSDGSDRQERDGTTDDEEMDVIGCADCMNADKKTIKIFESSVNSALAPIPFFDTSLLMNYIAYHGVVLLHPRSTVEGLGIKNFDPAVPLSDRTTAAYQSYTKNGFKFVEDLRTLEIFDRHVCNKSLACPGAHRRLTDEGVLHIPFVVFDDLDTAGLSTLRFAEEGRESWFEWGLTCRERCGGATISRGKYLSTKDG